MLGSLIGFARKVAASHEVRHDVSLFAGTLLATGILQSDSITRDAVVAAVVTAARRAIKARLRAASK